MADQSLARSAYRLAASAGPVLVSSWKGVKTN